MIILKSGHASIEYVAFETHLYPDSPWDVGQNDLGSNALKVNKRIDRIIVQTLKYNHCDVGIIDAELSFLFIVKHFDDNYSSGSGRFQIFSIKDNKIILSP